MPPRCTRCVYFHWQGTLSGSSGACERYPTPVLKRPTQKCGEYRFEAQPNCQGCGTGTGVCEHHERYMDELEAERKEKAVS